MHKQYFLVDKCSSLKGSIKVSTSKNAVLPILAASLLTDQMVILEDMPYLSDVNAMCVILKSLGTDVRQYLNKLILTTNKLSKWEVPSNLTNKLRASSLIMGPMLSRTGFCKIANPGGCDIGQRPIDIHLFAFKALGADIIYGKDFIQLSANKLRGCEIQFPFPSVGATENTVMAAALAKGITIIKNAATEPEIVDLCTFLNSMGACIKGAGSKTIIIKGVQKLYATQYKPIPDRIEAGTYMLAAALTGGDIKLYNVKCEHLLSFEQVLCQAGAKIIYFKNGVRIIGPKQLNPVNIIARPYPGYPTDLQAQAAVLASVAKGESLIKETVFDNRFNYTKELSKMGAQINVDNPNAYIKGVNELYCANLCATDLRGGAAMVLAGLKAQGTTIIDNIEYIDRGYEHIEKKLTMLGANIKRIQ